jgi:hypothetical protein
MMMMMMMMMRMMMMMMMMMQFSAGLSSSWSMSETSAVQSGRM